MNKRYGTPHWLLLLLFVVGVAPVILGFSVGAIASMVAVAATPMLAIMVIASLLLPKRFPQLHASAPFRLRWGVHVVTVIVGVVILAVQAMLLIGRMKPAGRTALVVWLVIGFIVWLARRGHVAAVLRARAQAGSEAQAGGGTARAHGAADRRGLSH